MAEFEDFEGFRALLRAQPGMDGAAHDAAVARNGQLTKPPGALGRLEDLALWYAGWRRDPRPRIAAPQVIVFAGNHGVTAQGVSAFPAEVTHQMVANFEHGAPAMTEAECTAALAAGWDAVADDADLLVVGEMGIGNTTAAAAIACALYGGSAADWTGRGTGVDGAGLDRKTQAVAAAVARHGRASDALAVLASLGGRELAAMAGAIASARAKSVPVILDGFICCAAAACLEHTQPGALDHAVAGHQSAEQAHARLLERLGKTPVLALGMRLGEGSGAALAIQVLKGAVACHSGMATFAEAGVADG